jgi:hypothetical protein
MLPMFFGLVTLVVDGSNLMAKRRMAQNAADASALAVAQSIELGPGGAVCGAGCLAKADEYSSANGGPAALHACSDTAPSDPADTNCYAYPYVDRSGVSHDQEVEVRLRLTVSGFFASVAGHLGAFHVSARAVASTGPVVTTTATTIPGTTNPGTTIPGATSTSTSTSVTTVTTVSGGTAAALFAKNTACGPANGIVVSGNSADIKGGAISNGSFTIGGNPQTHVNYAEYGGPNHCAISGAGKVDTQPPTVHTDDRPWPLTFDRNAICSLPGAVDRASAIVVRQGDDGIFCSDTSVSFAGNDAKVTMIAPVVVITSQTVTLDPYVQGLLVYQTGPNSFHFPNNSHITGTIWIENGDLIYDGNQGTTGFYEAQNVFVRGNSFDMQGSGPLIGGTTTVTTTTSTSTATSTADPVTVYGTTVPDSTSTATTTVGTSVALDE